MLQVLSGYRTLEVVQKKTDDGDRQLCERFRVANFFVAHDAASRSDDGAALEVLPAIS